MRVAVTGASGNLGSALLRRLRVESGVEILGISRRAPLSGTDPWLEVDISRDDAAAGLTESLRGVDVLVHLAWKLQPAHDERQLWATNVNGTANVLSAATAAGVGHIVVTSSVGAYSPADKSQVVDETWPVNGIPTSGYSRHKAQVERLLDNLERDQPGLVVTRIRPGLVFQAGAASEISRLFLGPLVPVRLLGRVPLPLLPLPRTMTFQAVHADDVAGAIWTVIDRRAPGPFNVAATPILAPEDLGNAVRARRVVPIPEGVLRAVASITWHARLQPTEPGWIDLATQCPIMSVERLTALGWTAQHSSIEALHELVTGLRDGTGDLAYPSLAPRSQPRRR